MIWKFQASKSTGLTQFWIHVNKGWGIPETPLTHSGAHGREEVTGPVDVFFSLTMAKEVWGATAGELEANARLRTYRRPIRSVDNSSLKPHFRAEFGWGKLLEMPPVCCYTTPVCPCICHFSAQIHTVFFSINFQKQPRDTSCWANTQKVRMPEPLPLLFASKFENTFVI